MPSTLPAGTAKETSSTATHALVRRDRSPRLHAEVAAQVLDLDRGGHAVALRSCRRSRQRKSCAGRRLPARDRVRAGLVGVGAARAEGAAGEARADRRHGAGDRAERLVALHACPAPARSAAGRACRDAAGSANSSAVGALSTTSPAYITDTRSATRATMPRSWVISRMREAELALQVGEQPQDLRLHRDVERGGRLVGDQQLGLAHQRHGDHHALAQAARELVRELAEPHARRGDADAAQQFGGAVAAPRRAGRPCGASAPRPSASRS